MEERVSKLEQRQDQFEQVTTEILVKLGDLVGELKVRNAHDENRAKELRDLKRDLREFGLEQVKIKEKMAESKPMIELVRALNVRIWFLIASALASAIGIGGMLASKLAGG